MQRTYHKTIVIHPHTGQFVINELPTLVLCGTVWGVRRHGRVAIDSYCHSNCLDALVAVTLPLSLPEANPLLHRYGTTCQRIRYYPSQSGLYGAVSYRGFSRAPKPAATILWVENRKHPFNGQKHAPS